MVLSMDEQENIPNTGAVFTFGRSLFGNDTSSCFWLKNDRIVCLSCGDEHTAMITETGKVYVFGSNDWGQLGLGHNHSVNKPTCVKRLKMHKAKSVACGRYHTLVSTLDNQLFAFGNNGDAQLGTDSTENSNVPVKVNTSSISDIKQIGAGADFSAILTSDGELFVWGSNVEGQLGLGDDVNEVEHPTLLKSSVRMESMSCGYYHMAAVSESGGLYTFGENENGKLGVRENSDTTLSSKVILDEGILATQVACGGSHTAFISRNGHAYSFGGGTHGQLGHGADILHTSKPVLIEKLRNHKVTHISCGENFTCVLTKRGVLFTFGDGRHGKLALAEENFTNQFEPLHCSRFNEFTISSAECGGCHLIVLASKGRWADTHPEDDEILKTMDGTKFHATPNDPDAWPGLDDLQHKKFATLDGIANVSIAREKRRHSRMDRLTRTLPPLKTLGHTELLEAANSLPNLAATDGGKETAGTEWVTLKKKQGSTISEISEFNKVHTIQNGNTFSPVRVLKSEDKEENELKKQVQKEQDMNKSSDAKVGNMPASKVQTLEKVQNGEGSIDEDDASVEEEEEEEEGSEYSGDEEYESEMEEQVKAESKPVTIPAVNDDDNKTNSLSTRPSEDRVEEINTRQDEDGNGKQERDKDQKVKKQTEHPPEDGTDGAGEGDAGMEPRPNDPSTSALQSETNAAEGNQPTTSSGVVTNSGDAVPPANANAQPTSPKKHKSKLCTIL